VLGRQQGVVTREQVISAGLSRHLIEGRLQSGRWQRLHRGVFAAFSGPVPRQSLLWGAVLRAGEDAVLSHQTAAETWRLSDQSSGQIHVTIPRNAASLAVPGLVIHYSSRLDAARHPVRLPPQTKLEETVLDLAEWARTAENAVAWPIRACQRRLTTPDRIMAVLEDRNRFRWRRDVADAIPEIRVGVHSPLELRYLRDVERRHRLPRGDRQVPTVRGKSLQYIDVRYTEYGVVVELDGVLAHTPERRQTDAKRDNANTLEGYQTLRYGWVPVAYHPCATAIEVYRLLHRNGLRTPLRPCGVACLLASSGSAPRVRPPDAAKPSALITLRG
jgi:very-short-patch-repair endonuclease